MEIVLGISQVSADLKAVAENFRRNGWQFANKITQNWVMMIHLTDAIDTGDMLRAVNWHPQETSAELKQYIVDASDNPKVTYDGFVEGGTKFMTGRFPAQKGIERTDFMQMIGSFVESGLSHAE